ncbi:MAG: stage III sporulation AC/AD family protein [Oscillospiraceae bacterium]|nr:stage III sporulation AC/AD family protein [Clostridiales bacterium]MDD7673189.1 stage III sporulation AC/AD family protein [Oscillospiraceae bacterium]MDY5642404.1 stage III sporulation AC/AD family protein [Candidatus Faecousia sp.]
MEPFWKAAALALIAGVLSLTLKNQDKEYGLLLSIAACLMVTAITVTYLKPVYAFLKELETLGDLRGDMLAILIKALGVGLASEIASMICTDAGNASLTKAIQLLGGAVILYLSVPMFSALMDLIQKIVGEL